MRSTFVCLVLHSVLELFKAEPFTVDGHAEVAQVNRVLGGCYILGGLREQDGALVVVIIVLLVLLRHLRWTGKIVVMTAHHLLQKTRSGKLRNRLDV